MEILLGYVGPDFLVTQSTTITSPFHSIVNGNTGWCPTGAQVDSYVT